MHLSLPPLRLRDLLTALTVVFAFILAGGLCWTALVLFLIWAGGPTFLLLASGAFMVGVVFLCRRAGRREGLR